MPLSYGVGVVRYFCICYLRMRVVCSCVCRVCDDIKLYACVCEDFVLRFECLRVRVYLLCVFVCCVCVVCVGVNVYAYACVVFYGVGV